MLSCVQSFTERDGHSGFHEGIAQALARSSGTGEPRVGLSDSCGFRTVSGAHRPLQWPLTCRYLYRQRLYVVLCGEPLPGLPGTVQCYPAHPSGIRISRSLWLRGRKPVWGHMEGSRERRLERDGAVPGDRQGQTPELDPRQSCTGKPSCLGVKCVPTGGEVWLLSLPVWR